MESTSPCQFRQDVPAVDQVRLAVGVDPDPAPLFLQFGRHLPDQVEPEERLAVAAENHLFIARGVADGSEDFGGSQVRGRA